MFPEQITSNFSTVSARNYSSRMSFLTSFWARLLTRNSFIRCVVVALVLTLAEYIATIKSEYKYIWKWRYIRSFGFMLRKWDWLKHLVKGSIVVAKGTLFPGQVSCNYHADVRRNDLNLSTTLQLTTLCSRVNYTLIQIYLNRGPIQPHQCKTSFIFLAFCTCVSFATFDAVLLLRGMILVPTFNNIIDE